MAGSETGVTDLMDEMDLEDVNDTGYEQDFDVEIIDGFYHQNIAFMNDKVRIFAEYWMKLYSNCCLQRDYAVELLNDGKPEEAKKLLFVIGLIHLDHRVFRNYYFKHLQNQSERS